MRPYHLIILVTIAVSLTACDNPEERRRQETRVEASLPQGCKLTDLGEYHDIEELVIVTCPASTTTNESWEQHSGNSVKHYQGVVVTPNQP